MNSFPSNYPRELIPYSWSYKEHYGILPYFNRYCKFADRNSVCFFRNYLTDYFKKKLKLDFLSESIINYINFIVKCFNISFDEEDGCFTVKMKRRKDNHRIPVFDKEEFFKVSMAIGPSKNSSKIFLKMVLSDAEENYNKYI